MSRLETSSPRAKILATSLLSMLRLVHEETSLLCECQNRSLWCLLMNDGSQNLIHSYIAFISNILVNKATEQVMSNSTEEWGTISSTLNSITCAAVFLKRSTVQKYVGSSLASNLAGLHNSLAESWCSMIFSQTLVWSFLRVTKSE